MIFEHDLNEEEGASRRRNGGTYTPTSDRRRSSGYCVTCEVVLNPSSPARAGTEN
jgi:hypothetical protein